MKRTPLFIGAAALVVGVAGGGLIGRTIHDDGDRAAQATLPQAVPVSTVAGDAPPAQLDPAYQVAAAEYPGSDGGSPITSASPMGTPTTGAGEMEPNPGGAPDLTPDPEAGISGTPPAVEGAPEDPDRPDAEALEAVTTMIAEVATLADGDIPAPATAAGPVPAFDDPCAENPGADVCAGGVEATVLGQRRLPTPQGVWYGQVHANSIYAAECARQLPGLDWRADSVWTIVVTVPTDGTMHVQFFHAKPGWEASYSAEAGTRVESRVQASDELQQAWTAAWQQGAATPLVPLCLKVPYQAQVEPNRAGCIGYLSAWGWVGCQSKVEMAVTGTDDRGFTWGAGLYSRYFRFADDGGLPPGEAEALRREVEINPLDPWTFEVKVPFTSTVSAATGEYNATVRTAQLVTAVGYAAGVDCRTVDPAAGLVLDPLPVTRQIGRTRYWAPEDTRRQEREAVITMTVPWKLAQGEGINICVFWYTFDGPSWQGPTVVNIEQHTVVPPSRGATELRFAGAGVGGGGLFSLPHAQLPEALNADRVIVSFLDNPRLNSFCGFSGTNPAPLLRPLDDPGFLCRIDWSTYADPPGDELVYVELREPFTPAESGVVNAHAQRRIGIDNRGCPESGCGPARTERFNLRDGSWVDLTLTKVPLATEPLLRNGRIIGGRHDGWTVNPGGYQTLAPTLRTTQLPEDPQLDSIGSRLERNAANPQSALDLVWRADRPVTVSVFLSPRHRTSNAACPTRNVAVPAPGGTPTDRGRITVAGLCPGTTYVAQLQLIQDFGGDAPPRVTTIEWNTGQWLYLTATTERAPVNPEFDYEYSLTIDSIEGSRSARGAVGSGVVFLGPATLMGLPPAARDCAALDAGRPIAAGSRGADNIVNGEVRVQIDLTVTVWTIDSSGAPCPPAGAVWTGRPVRIQIVDTIRWDGTSPQTFTLTTGNGTVLTLAMRPATD